MIIFLCFRLKGLYRGMEEGLSIMNPTVVLVMVLKRQMMIVVTHVKKFVRHIKKKVIFTEENKSLLHVLTNICAIIGGIFTVSGIIDAFVYHGHRAIKRKIELMAAPLNAFQSGNKWLQNSPNPLFILFPLQ
ncbi:hypothetical protein Taro_031108 [Colocasia esculenta]|uniref:Endoplasmic reticulum vesicle transporter C-terminal domain-containing protein n=1 Tax=Colocasia esculenta TaxID=4460 RepID=A0A843VTS9_COLES|nr:hypothetical protein [Colocasia esculenta]